MSPTLRLDHAVAAVMAASLQLVLGAATATAASPMKTEIVSVRLLTATGQLTEPLPVPRVVKSDAAWSAQLTVEQYRITRTHGTERAFCGVFHDNHQSGVYACVGCGLPLFRSNAKFDSGTGWPSFFQPLAQENLGQTRDVRYGMIRTEVHCARCDGHLGHVFTDGPPPTRLRYCINSDALTFFERPLSAPAPERIVLGAGGSTNLPAALRALTGVGEVRPGYAGGHTRNPKPTEVRSGRTGHAEVIEVEYDPTQVGLEKLLEAFWTSHDPFLTPGQSKRAGTDPLRSVIFFQTPEQEASARAAAASLARQHPGRSLATEICLATTFYPALR